eukprot:CAMPEP_0180685072 /NCGR_PEP_ID=MMETSP1037_2-20121125/72128_1 /TAXON_ID=632150 /ORGANISM="Azadinium spinosum, Strain 3D9" /LENGTH=64 /DNA_ID=CAMNT_0022715573 /DNA_START=156 /DNA_END=347 /DNA_ORIENTATION=-
MSNPVKKVERNTVAATREGTALQRLLCKVKAGTMIKQLVAHRIRACRCRSYQGSPPISTSMMVW